MLEEGQKVDLLHGQRRKAAKIAQKRRRKELAKHGGEQVLSYLAAKKAGKLKDWLIMRDLKNRDKRNQMREAIIEATTKQTGGFFSVKAKPWLAKRSKKFASALEKHGPKLQKHADKWGGRAAMMGAHVDKLKKSNPKSMAALKWGGAVTGAIAVKTGVDVVSHHLAHKAKMRDPNYEYETRRRYADNYVREEMGRFPHTSNAAKKVDHRLAANVAITRSMALDTVAKTGKAVMDNKKYKVPRRTQTGTKTESISDIITMKANDIYEVLPFIAGAGKVLASLGGRALAKTAVKSAVRGAAGSVGSSMASKAMAPKRKRVEGVDEGFGGLLRGLGTAVRATAGSIAGSKGKAKEAAAGAVKKAAAAATDKRSYAQKGWDKFKSSDTGKKAVAWSKTKSGKKILQKGAQGLAKGVGTGVGTGIGNRIGNRIERGSRRHQIQQARFDRKLSRIRGGRSRYESVIESDVSPSARSAFEINPIKQTKDFMHMKRNAYIERKSQISKKAKLHNVSRMAKPDETQNEGLNEMKASKIARMAAGELGRKAWKATKKHPGKVAGGAATLAAYGAWKTRRTNRKYQDKMAQHHERKYNQHVANLDYLDDVRAAKERRAGAAK